MALLNVDNLSVSFVTRNGTNKAVDNVSFSVEERQITAIIGESGSGKSVSCYAMLGLVPSPPGRIDGGTAHFQGQDLLSLSEAELRAIRGRDIAMIFQDPMSCLNPYLKIIDQITEPILIHEDVSRQTAEARALEMMKKVGKNRQLESLMKSGQAGDISSILKKNKPFKKLKRKEKNVSSIKIIKRRFKKKTLLQNCCSRY